MSNLRLRNKLTMLGLLLLTLSACSGSGNEDSNVGIENNNDNDRSGQFLDAEVSGLAYRTESGSATTDSEGRFFYKPGETITFTIANWTLPSVPAASLITPFSIFDSNAQPTGSGVNLARLLQSLDSDSNLDNGIQLPEMDAAALTSQLGELSGADFSSAEFDVIAANFLAISGAGNGELIDAEAAQTHLEATLQTYGLGDTSRSCTKTHSLVGASAAFSMLFHDVAGNAEVLDDCTIEITNFFYDGLGPQVYFYAAKARNYSGSDAIILGERLNGTVFSNDVIRLKLPEGTTLDDIDSISVWCAEVGINFGDVVF